MLLTNYIHDLKRIISTDRDYPYDNIDDRLVEDWIHMQRALWLRNEYNKNRSIESNVYQTLEGVELVFVDKSDYQFVKAGEKFLRTSHKIPRPIELHNRYLIEVRSTTIGDELYSLVRFDDFRYKGHGKFNKRMVYCFYYDDYIFINITKQNPKIGLLDFVSIDIVAENPSDIYKIKGLDPKYQEYPIPLSMWEYLKGAIMNSNIKQFLSTKDGTSELLAS